MSESVGIRGRDRTGERVGRLTVVSPVGPRQWLCRCDCGNTKHISTDSLSRSQSRSCGCLQRERASQANLRHGQSRAGEGSRPAEYETWAKASARARGTSGEEDIPRYAGRGITICVRWADDFAAFFADMGPRPSADHSIDRINNNGGYWCGRPECPECGPAKREPNCRWATRTTQNRNRRSNKVVEFRGETAPLIVFAERLGMDRKGYDLVKQRIRCYGWTVEDALTTPAGLSGKHANPRGFDRVADMVAAQHGGG